MQMSCYLNLYRVGQRQVWIPVYTKVSATRIKINAQDILKELNHRNINLLKHSGYSIYHKKIRGFSPQANYIDRATAACRRS
jgi:hypothetical protein